MAFLICLTVTGVRRKPLHHHHIESIDIFLGGTFSSTGLITTSLQSTDFICAGAAIVP